MPRSGRATEDAVDVELPVTVRDSTSLLSCFLSFSRFGREPIEKRSGSASRSTAWRRRSSSSMVAIMILLCWRTQDLSLLERKQRIGHSSYYTERAAKGARKRLSPKPDTVGISAGSWFLPRMCRLCSRRIVVPDGMHNINSTTIECNERCRHVQQMSTR